MANLEAERDSQQGFKNLSQNVYPGRVIIMGMSNTEKLIQVYAVMGRSANSRNRILELADDNGLAIVRTAPFDTSKVEDPSLIIYNAMRQTRAGSHSHIVSNGDQTDTVDDYFERFAPLFSDSLKDTLHEPDSEKTSRITGVLNSFRGYGQLSRIYASPALKNGSIRAHWDIKSFEPGFGYCFHTYKGDGKPLPAFNEDPYLVPLNGSAEEIAQTYWGILNRDNRVALVVKEIGFFNSSINFHIINRFPE